MTVTIDPAFPNDSTTHPICAPVPSSPFFVNIDLPSTVTTPISVTITETPNAAVGVPGATYSGCRILNTSRSTTVVDRRLFLRRTTVPSISSFRSPYPRFKFQVHVDYSGSTLDAFKGSIMRIEVADSAGYTASEEVEIINTNPNAHYHWDTSEPDFVDGWYFKCVHIDPTSLEATPFFFLYGINDPSSSGSGGCPTSFVMFTRAGTANLTSGLVPTGAAPTTPEKHYATFPITDFNSDRTYGNHTTINTNFTASDRGCKGTHTLASVGTVTWDLRFTKIHRHIKSDYNPLEPFEPILQQLAPTITGYGVYQHTLKQLYRYLVKAPCISAYAMNHNMNCFVTGDITWGTDTYRLENVKGYQDENWGAGGFPHPYVWMQANNFKDSGGTLDYPNTSLIAVYTPGMPIGGSLTTGRVGTICFRHAGNVYNFFMASQNLLLPGTSTQIPVTVFGTVNCYVDFEDPSGTRTRIDMSNPASIATIGPMGRPEVPVGWEITGTSGSGDVIRIEASCPRTSVLKLEAPMSGCMTADVTKESLHTTVTVTITPSGGTAQTYVSYFATAEFGD